MNANIAKLLYLSLVYSIVRKLFSDFYLPISGIIHPEVFLKVFLNFLHGNNLCQNLFFNKVAGGGLQL